MRVTQNTIANMVRDNIQTIQQRSELLQQEASTGLKVSAPGDDPVSAQQILDMKALMASGDQYQRNISNGTSWLSMAESAMSGMGDAITRVKELSLEMSTGTTDPSAYPAAVTELQQLKSQLISLGNTQINGRYIFGGFKNDTPPFDSAGTFNGTDDNVNIEIGQGEFLPINYSGGKILRGGTPPGSTGTDVIGTIDNIITALNGNNPAGVKAELTNLDKSLDQVLSYRTDLGARLNRLTGASSIIDDTKLSLTKVVSDKQDIDFAQVLSDLTKQQTAYQAALAASAKVSQISLLDYLK